MSWRHSRKQSNWDDKARAERDSWVMIEVGNNDMSGEGYSRIVMSGTMLQASWNPTELLSAQNQTRGQHQWSASGVRYRIIGNKASHPSHQVIGTGINPSRLSSRRVQHWRCRYHAPLPYAGTSAHACRPIGMVSAAWDSGGCGPVTRSDTHMEKVSSICATYLGPLAFLLRQHNLFNHLRL